MTKRASLEPQRTQKAARVILEAWRDKAVVEALPPDCQPRNSREGWDLDLAAHPVALSRKGAPAGSGLGANVLGDPRAALTWLANDLGRYDELLRAGQIVTTGTCAVPMPLEDGLEMAADFGLIGRIGARFAG